MRKNEAAWLDKYGRWQIKVQKDGERRTFTNSTPGTKGKIACEKKADKWLESGVKNDNVRFKKAYGEFLDEVKLLTSTANYRQREYIGRVWLMPAVEHKKVNSIMPADWQKCINKAYKNGRAKKTLQNIRGCVTAFYKFCKKSGYEMQSPEDVTIPKGAPQIEKSILQPDQLKVLFSKGDNFYLYAFRFFVVTGLRRGELCGLKHSDIKDDVLHVRRSINGFNEITGGKNKNAQRYFVLSDHAKTILTAQKTMLKQLGIISPYIFPNKQGKATMPGYLFKNWQAFREAYGITCSLHELRHTFISINQADIPEQLLKRAVGHSKSMDTFGVYGHEVDGDMERVASTIDHTLTTLLE